MNTVYCQQFLNTLSALPPEKLKFFDEAGVHSGTGNPAYGNSLKGEIAVEIISGNKKGANVTLSFWCGQEGVLYANTVEGMSNSTNFLNFFAEAGQATTALSNTAIEFGDYIILDLAPHIVSRLGIFCKDGYCTWEHKSFTLHPFHQNSTSQNSFSIN